MIRPLIGFAAAIAALTGLAGAPAFAQGINEEPLPRFEDRLCPGIIGLEREFAELMVSRLRMNAQRFGLRLAREDDCDPNLVIAFVDDGQAYFADLYQRRSYLFAHMDRPKIDALLAQEGPVTVWHQVTPRTRDGLRVGSRENLTDPPQTGMWQAHSRIYRPVRHDITYALVLFDRAAVEGMTLLQLADHATLRALATDFPEEAGTIRESMLTLFEQPDARPGGLTEFDSAWLHRLYGGIPNIPASVRLRGVERASAD